MLILIGVILAFMLLTYRLWFKDTGDADKGMR